MNSPRKDLLKKRHYNFDLGPLVKGVRFYWVPLILLLVPILYIMGYGMHFYSAEPEYFLGVDEVLASSFSGYELAKMGLGGQIALGFWVFSLALLVVSAVLLSLYPIFRGVKYCNIVFGIPWVFFTICNTSLLIVIAEQVRGLNIAYYQAKELDFPDGMGPYGLANITYWVLFVAPLGLMLWWWAANLINLFYSKKKKALGEVPSQTESQIQGEEEKKQPESELVLSHENHGKDAQSEEKQEKREG